MYDASICSSTNKIPYHNHKGTSKWRFYWIFIRHVLIYTTVKWERYCQLFSRNSPFSSLLLQCYLMLQALEYSLQLQHKFLKKNVSYNQKKWDNAECLLQYNDILSLPQFIPNDSKYFIKCLASYVLKLMGGYFYHLCCATLLSFFYNWFLFISYIISPLINGLNPSFVHQEFVEFIDML